MKSLTRFIAQETLFDDEGEEREVEIDDVDIGEETSDQLKS